MRQDINGPSDPTLPMPSEGTVVHVRDWDKLLRWSEADQSYSDHQGNRWDAKFKPLDRNWKGEWPLEPQRRKVSYDTFEQIVASPVHDGNLGSKTERDRLQGHGLIDRGYGWNFLTAKGVEVAVALGLLKA